MNLQDKKFYLDNADIHKYNDAQIRRGTVKALSKRDAKHYRKCARSFIDLVPSCANMICMGTRNNYERDILRLELKSKRVNVYSLDIAPSSNADYIMSFNKFDKEWENKWDVVFSNAIDHAQDATETFYEWLRITKKNGMIVLGFAFGAGISEFDCNTFSRNNVDAFITENKDKVSLISMVSVSYQYYILRKI